jgi:hypothetical protein
MRTSIDTDRYRTVPHSIIDPGPVLLQRHNSPVTGIVLRAGWSGSLYLVSGSSRGRIERPITYPLIWISLCTFAQHASTISTSREDGVPRLISTNQPYKNEQPKGSSRRHRQDEVWLRGGSRPSRDVYRRQRGDIQFRPEQGGHQEAGPDRAGRGGYGVRIWDWTLGLTVARTSILKLRYSYCSPEST